MVFGRSKEPAPLPTETTIYVTTGAEDTEPGARVWPERVVDELVDRTWAGAHADLMNEIGSEWCAEVHPLVSLTGPTVQWELVLPEVEVAPGRIDHIQAAFDRHWGAAHRRLH